MAPLPIPVGYSFFAPYIRAAAEANALDPTLVAAVCWQESGFKTDGFRFEPNFWNRYMKRTPQYASLNPRRYSSSYGLMQIMWVVAVENGFDGAREPEALFQPSVGLEYGCRNLRRLLDWADTFTTVEAPVRLRAAIAAYNGGRGGNKPTETLRTGYYARSVLTFQARLAEGT